MQRSVPEGVHAEPFRTLAEAQAANGKLVEQARKAEAKYGNATRGDRDVAIELIRLRRNIRMFEWRLAATGARLPEGQQRGFAQSLLDFWALRQADLRSLTGKLKPKRPTFSRPSRSNVAAGCLLLPYDKQTAAAAAERAERAYQSLPDDAAREAARIALVGLIQRGEQPHSSAEATLAPFLGEGVIIKRSTEAGSVIEIGHDALPVAWPLLKKWIADDDQERADRERLKADAEAWAKSGSAAELPRGEIIDRAARYSEQDETLTDYVAAARRRRTVERLLQATVAILFAGLIGYAIWSSLTRPSKEESAQVLEEAEKGRIAEVSEEIAQNQVIVDVPKVDAGGDDASPRGLTGWIWIGTADDPKIQGANGEKLDLAAIAPGTRVRTIPNLKVRQNRPSNDGANIAGKREAGVSGGSLALVLEKNVGIDVKGTTQFWLKVQLLPVVYIQHDRTSGIQLGGMREVLVGNGFIVPPAEGLPNIARPDASPPFDVRFYYPQDEAAAQKVARIVARLLDAGPPPSPTSLVESPLAERVKTGTIEVWLYQP